MLAKVSRQKYSKIATHPQICSAVSAKNESTPLGGIKSYGEIPFQFSSQL
jgi:hypothetical protein